MQKTLRKREVTLSRISVYIVVIIVTCHTIRWCLIREVGKKSGSFESFFLKRRRLPQYQLFSESTSALWWSLPVLSHHGLVNMSQVNIQLVTLLRKICQFYFPLSSSLYCNNWLRSVGGETTSGHLWSARLCLQFLSGMYLDLTQADIALLIIFS